MREKFLGTGVALVTPFQADGTVDVPALKKLVDDCIVAGCEYLVALGTTAESATLTETEKELVLSMVIDANAKRVPLMVGVGGNNTAAILAQLRELDFTNIDAILSVCPYYNKPSQEGLYQHLSAIATKSPVPVMLYNIPGRTGVNLTVDTLMRLAKAHSNILGVKEASGDLSQIMEIIAQRPEGFLVVSGDDALTLPIISLGGDGVISATANALPSYYSGLVRACMNADFETARSLQYKALPLFNMFFEEGNPAGVKAALTIQGRCGDTVRLPLIPVSEGLRQRMASFLVGLGNV